MTTVQELAPPDEDAIDAHELLGEPIVGSLEDLETAIMSGANPACEDCSERVGIQSHMLAAFVGIGRLSVEAAIDRVNERVCCTHLGASAMRTAIAL